MNAGMPVYHSVAKILERGSDRLHHTNEYESATVNRKKIQ